MGIDLIDLKEKAYKKRKGLPWYGVNVTHRISIRIVNIIKDLDVNPDLITLFGAVLGVISAIVFSSAGRFSFLIGALLLELYYIFDAVDGQYARTRGKTSRTGAYFDYISNHIVHSLVFLGIGIGLYRATTSFVFLILGFFAAWGMMFMYAIHDARSAVLKGAGNLTKHAESSPAEKHTIVKRIFMIAHKTCTYPPIMNVITCFAVVGLFSGKTLALYSFFMVYYGIVVNIVWMSKLAKFVKDRALDDN